MTRTQLISHYLDIAGRLRARGHRRWSNAYAKRAIQIMEGR